MKDNTDADTQATGRAGNLHRATSGVSVFTACQPTANELDIMLEKIALDGYPVRILCFFSDIRRLLLAKVRLYSAFNYKVFDISGIPGL